MANAACEEAAAEDEEDVGEDGAEHAGLNDADLTVFESDDADLLFFFCQRRSIFSGREYSYNQFNSISKCCIHQPTQRLTKLNRQLFSSKAQQRSQGYNSEEVQNENRCWAPSHSSGDDSQWHEHQEHVDIIASEGLPRLEPKVCRPFHIRSIVFPEILPIFILGRMRKKRGVLVHAPVESVSQSMSILSVVPRCATSAAHTSIAVVPAV